LISSSVDHGVVDDEGWRSLSSPPASGLLGKYPVTTHKPDVDVALNCQFALFFCR